eukprot:TRINITY_DN32257_c0_g2_i1.p1 TRINITY_DN32257_c0_g2~~TRINITY_DN32257_c0_g2_i1.p1  ORF type:complete len:1751 (+),score=429.81 TRINITY_DN32257_c0_g2_i1:85-5337(+)
MAASPHVSSMMVSPAGVAVLGAPASGYSLLATLRAPLKLAGVRHSRTYRLPRSAPLPAAEAASDSERRLAAGVAAALGAAFTAHAGRRRRRRCHNVLRRAQGSGTATPTEEQTAAPVARPLRVKRRPPKATMSRRTALEEFPSLEYLERCLAAGEFEKADQITRDLVLVLCGAEALDRGFALAKDVKALPVNEMRAIDRLWRQHSAGRLGYSVQSAVYREVGGEWNTFMQRIGWLQPERDTGKALLRYWPRRQFEYSMEAPTGHLPLTNMIRGRDVLQALLEHSAWQEGSDDKPAENRMSLEKELSGRAWWSAITGSGDDVDDDDTSASGDDASDMFGGVREWLASLTGTDSQLPASIPESSEASAAPAAASGGASVQREPDGDSSPSASPRAKSPLIDSSEGLDFEFRGPGSPIFRITLVTGFETFNVRLYSEAAKAAVRQCPGLQVCLFTDKDIEQRRDLVESALAESDVLFCSLLFDYDQCEWLREHIAAIPVRYVFESALELMSFTQVGEFSMANAGKGGGGMPPAVRQMLSKLTGTRDEDRIAGYTKFLKAGPKLLKFLPPFGPLPSLRRWLQTYAYWSGGGSGNVAKMLRYIAREFGSFNVEFNDLLGEEEDVVSGTEEPEVVEIPSVGLLHPALKRANEAGPFFSTPKEYMDWYRTYRPEAFQEDWPVCALLLYRKHVVSELPYIWQLVNYLEEKHQLLPLPIFIQGVDAHIAARDLLTSRAEREAIAAGLREANPTKSPGAVEIDCLVNTIGFPLVGGPAGSMEGGRNAEIAKEILSGLNVPYVVSAPLLIQDVDSWREQGIGGLQGIVLYALPELDGAIDTVPLGGLVKGTGEIELLPDRAERLANRLKRWVSLRRKAKAERKVAVVLYGYPPGLGAAGTAALLNVPRSLHRLLTAMKEQGYDVGELPEDPEELVREVREADLLAESGSAYGNAEETDKGAIGVEVDTLGEWLSRSSQEAVEAKWGEGLAKSGIRTIGEQLLLGGRKFGNVWIGVQPPLGIPGDPMRLLFERDMTPHPQYVAFYKYLENGFQADAVVHFGMHGTAEWLPGRPLGNMEKCWPDQLIGGLPNIYLYAANNPSESILAKRRGYGCLVSHNVPPYSRAGLYRELTTIRGLISEMIERSGPEGDVGAAAASAGAMGIATAVKAAEKSSAAADGGAGPTVEGAIIQAVLASGLEKDVPFPPAAAAVVERFRAENGSDDEAVAEEVAAAIASSAGGSAGSFMQYASQLRSYLDEVESTLFSAGLHTLGQTPDEEQLRSYLTAYFDGEGRPQLSEEMLLQLCSGKTAEEAASACGEESLRAAAHEAAEIRDLLMCNGDEMQSFLRALNGEYILPAPGGDLLRDGAGVLPTGRNFHALDPYRIPGKNAMARGLLAAEAAIEQHLRDAGSYPETIAVNIWGLEAIKTRGESVALVLGLIGARPVQEATGRVARYELIPLEELGRPRVDALCSLSGIFRDCFANVVDLLDDALRRAARADEPPEQNFIRKHFLELQATEDDEGAASRIFSNAAGEFGSLVNERVSAGNWDNTEELGETWASRNAFAFGRGQKGKERRGVLDSLLKSSASLVQLTDSVEYGLTDIQEYYANAGAMIRKMGDLQGKKVDALVVDTTKSEVRPKKLDATLRLEYRTKLLNPSWSKAMIEQGSGGAFEVSQRMTALVGWAATSRFRESWVWDQSVEQYVFNEEIAAKLRESNPEAFKNIVGRFLESNARDMWQAPAEVIERLQALYEELEDEMEGV